MSSSEKIAANRLNAQRSTGPTTAAGKAAVRLNALRHGLASRDIVVPGENPEEFAALLDSLRAELQPQGVLEDCLVAQVAAAEWRLRRISRIETGIFMEKIEYRRRDHRIGTPEPAVAPTPEEALYHQNTLMLGEVFSRNCDGGCLIKLLRYENAARRALFRALHELAALQSRRPSPAPPSPEEPEPAVTEQSQPHRSAPGESPVREVSSVPLAPQLPAPAPQLPPAFEGT